MGDGCLVEFSVYQVLLHLFSILVIVEVDLLNGGRGVRRNACLLYNKVFPSRLFSSLSFIWGLCHYFVVDFLYLSNHTFFALKVFCDFSSFLQTSYIHIFVVFPQSTHCNCFFFFFFIILTLKVWLWIFLEIYFSGFIPNFHMRY